MDKDIDQNKQHTQVAVLGAGPGGYAAAFLAADLGLGVSLIDSRPQAGGVCLYEGCIPSKALLHAAKILEQSKEAAAFGLHFAAPQIDMAALGQWKNSIIGKLSDGLEGLRRKRKIRYIQGRAAFVSPKQLRIRQADSLGAKELELSFQHAIIATGSQAKSLPQLPPSRLVIDAGLALKLENLPQKLAVLGGGYIGLEIGSVYAALGSQVRILEMQNAILEGVDSDIRRPLLCKIERFAQAVHTKTQVIAARECEDKIELTLRTKPSSQEEGAQEHAREWQESFDKVLVAIGRRPETADLGLERAAVCATKQGFIEVNECMRTSQENIYAIGDLTGPPMLAHKAAAQAKIAAQNIAGKKAAFAPYAIPAVIYTEPEIAYCGIIMEEEVKRKSQEMGIEIQTARFPWAASGRALTMSASEGMTKLAMDAKSKRVLGAAIVGHGAGELIAEAALAIEMGASIEDIALTIHPHPSLSESLMECSEIFTG